MIPTWGFSSLAGPPGLLAGLLGVRSRKKLVVALGLTLNALLTVFFLFWQSGRFG